jgi:hypothetical protein
VKKVLRRDNLDRYYVLQALGFGLFVACPTEPSSYECLGPQGRLGKDGQLDDYTRGLSV